MKKYLAALCITIGTVFGAELASGSDTGVSAAQNIIPILNQNYARDYVQVSYGLLNKQEIALLSSDEHFSLGLEYLNNKKLYTKKTVERGDSHSDKPKKIETVEVVDYAKATEQLELSIQKYSNPVSAYIFRNIVKTLYGANTKKFDSTLKKSEEILYRHQVCEGFIDYGRRQENTSPELALGIYKEGLSHCGKNKNTWSANVLAGRIAYIEKISKSRK